MSQRKSKLGTRPPARVENVVPKPRGRCALPGVEVTFDETVAGLRAEYPNAGLGPSVRRGAAFDRAVGAVFLEAPAGVYGGRAGDGGEVLVYYAENARLITCVAVERQFLFRGRP